MSVVHIDNAHGGLRSNFINLMHELGRGGADVCIRNLEVETHHGGAVEVTLQFRVYLPKVRAGW